MNLYLVHCGFYDSELCDGIYEGHINLFVAASNFEEAKARVRSEPDFKKKHMHIDGLQEIELVNGYRVQLCPDSARLDQTILNSNRHRDL
jgi:hypothetical protein